MMKYIEKHKSSLAFPTVRQYVYLSGTKQCDSNETMLFPEMSQPND